MFDFLDNNKEQVIIETSSGLDPTVVTVLCFLFLMWVAFVGGLFYLWWRNKQ